MNINKCNLCKHKSEVGIYNFQMCITCSDNPFMIDERFDAKEIKIFPQEAGEMWRDVRFGPAVTIIPFEEGRLHFQYVEGDKKASLYDPNGWHSKIIHGKNGWTREFPIVEDRNVERIEIEEVICRKEEECVYSVAVVFTSHQNLSDKPMKMILEFDKETP